MKKLLLGFILCLFLWSQGFGQGMSLDGLRNNLKYRLGTDDILFPDSILNDILCLSVQTICAHGLAYPKIDTIVLDTISATKPKQDYRLSQPALWVWGVKRQEGTPTVEQKALTSVRLSDLGKSYTSEAGQASYWSDYLWYNGFTYYYSGNDYVGNFIIFYPSPTGTDIKDTVFVSYFALSDTVTTLIVQNVYEDAIVDCALMYCYLRKGQTDMMVMYFNQWSAKVHQIRQEQLSRIYDLEVVPKQKGQ